MVKIFIINNKDRQSADSQYNQRGSYEQSLRNDFGHDHSDGAGKEGCACLAIDEKGLYLTSPAYVDRPLADPNRYAGNRKDVAARLNALSLDADSLLEQNRHRIPKITGESKKKVNPLKASKRSMKG